MNCNQNLSDYTSLKIYRNSLCKTQGMKNIYMKCYLFHRL